MTHIQISVKFDEDTHTEITRVTKTMRISPHKFIVTAVQEVQRMIVDRGREKLPLLVVQARAALDYEQTIPSLPVGLTVGPPEKSRKTLEPEQQKSAAGTRSKPAARPAS
jgi:hypothetical protein